MVVILFYVEEIKSFALRTIKVTDKYRKLLKNEDERLPDGTKKLYKKLWALLVSENIISKEEKEDIECIIDFRNDIAHSIQNLVFDLNVDRYSRSFIEFTGEQYEYGVIERLKRYKELMYERFSGKHVFEINMNNVLFSQAERTYLFELEQLDKKIQRLLVLRKAENIEIESEIDNIDEEVMKRIRPWHPHNVELNGQLTPQGMECLYELFGMGISNISISYLMRIPLKNISRRKNSWLKKNA